MYVRMSASWSRQQPPPYWSAFLPTWILGINSNKGEGMRDPCWWNTLIMILEQDPFSWLPDSCSKFTPAMLFGSSFCFKWLVFHVVLELVSMKEDCPCLSVSPGDSMMLFLLHCVYYDSNVLLLKLSNLFRRVLFDPLIFISTTFYSM